VTKNALFTVFGQLAAPTQTAAINPTSPWYMTFRDDANRLSTEYTLPVSTAPALRTKDYFYFGNLLVATLNSNCGQRFYASDHLGTPRLITDGNGTVFENHTYHPYGQEITTDTTCTPSLQFCAMERDQASGNDYDHARFHLTGMGRFLGVDRVGGHPRDPQSWNRFSYAGNNPLKLVDSNGLEVETFFVKSVKGFWRQVNRAVALAFRKDEKDVLVRGSKRIAEAASLEREAELGAKIIKHDAHRPNWLPHFQTQNAGGHTFFDVKDLVTPFWLWAFGQASDAAVDAAGKYVEEPGRRGAFGEPQREIDEETRIEEDKDGSTRNQEAFQGPCGPNAFCFQGSIQPKLPGLDWFGKLNPGGFPRY
jgi:RHS repeat-associated protein